MDPILHPDDPAHLARTFQDLADQVKILNGTYQHGLLDSPAVLPKGRSDVYMVDILWALFHHPGHVVDYYEMMEVLKSRDGDLFSETAYGRAFLRVAEKIQRPMSQRVEASAF